RSRIPYAPSVGREPFGARFQDGDGVAQHGSGLLRCGGEAVDAGRPGLQLHSALEVDGPDDHVAACAEIAHQDVDAAALPRTGHASNEAVTAQQQNTRARGVLEGAQVDRLGNGRYGRSRPWEDRKSVVEGEGGE